MCWNKRQNKQPVGHFIFATLILGNLKEGKKRKGGNVRKSYFQENRCLFPLQPPAEVECFQQICLLYLLQSLCEPLAEALQLGTRTPECSCSTRRILLLLLTSFFLYGKVPDTCPGSKWVLSQEICIFRSRQNVRFVNFTDVDFELKAYEMWEAMVTFFCASQLISRAARRCPSFLASLGPPSGKHCPLCLSQRPTEDIQCIKSHVSRGTNRWVGWGWVVVASLWHLQRSLKMQCRDMPLSSF